MIWIWMGRNEDEIACMSRDTLLRCLICATFGLTMYKNQRRHDARKLLFEEFGFSARLVERLFLHFLRGAFGDSIFAWSSGKEAFCSARSSLHSKMFFLLYFILHLSYSEACPTRMEA
jgi:hypothetical protein